MSPMRFSLERNVIVKAYQVTNPTGIEGLTLLQLPEPVAREGEVIVSIRACSLNYRDLGILHGGYYRNDKLPVIPLSDMAGVVASVGPGVRSFKAGDRVTASFVRDWVDGAPTDTVLRSGFGGGIDGFLCERASVPERCLLKIPDRMSFEQAATLPCAGVTVWHAFKRAPLAAGQTILLLGTGGVSIFGLQLAKAFGCRCIVTSSSDAKLDAAKRYGADEVINYRTQPEWSKEVRRLTGGVGVDHVLEVGGAGTLAQSIASTKVGGTISLIGVLARTEQNPALMPAALDCMSIHGIYVGSRLMLAQLHEFMNGNSMSPIIDRSFEFEQTPDAYRHLVSQQHVGKVVIQVA